MNKPVHQLYSIGLLWATLSAAAPAATDPGQAIFAGGCFWCMEADFEKLPGVLTVESGYTGGQVPNPDYKSVSKGGTGHYEAVRIHYDPATVSYKALLQVFWRNIDPYDADGQFCDKGESYRSAIFPLDADQALLAEQSKTRVRDSLDSATPLATEILEAGAFYPAEDYHQDYYKKNPVRYKYYRWSCGRDQRLEALWGTDP